PGEPRRTDRDEERFDGLDAGGQVFQAALDQLLSWKCRLGVFHARDDNGGCAPFEIRAGSTGHFRRMCRRSLRILMTAPQAVPRVRSNRQTPPVHLARVGLRGFKSFPDPVELRFEPGVAILVGPNGSGKSNVADAIVWASGSLSPTELRAEKPDDVLFAGAGERPPAAFCEVELVFDDAEDAAGLGVFKRRRHRAELKLARVATQVERARDVEAEVRARIRPLALQATAAERVERLAGELAVLEARLAALDAAGVEEQLAELEERRTATGLARRRSDERLEALLTERRAAEDELEDAAGRRESATAALYRMRSGAERLTVRSEAIGRLVEPLRRDAEESERAAADRPVGPTRAQLEAAAAAARAERDAAAPAERVARERLETLERVL